MKATDFAGLPSEGLTIFPFVGPSGAASLSIIMFVMTSEYRPNPRLSILAASYGFQPVAMTTAPTFRLNVFGCMFKSIAPYLHASTHLAQEVNLQAESSIAYFIGKAIGCGM